MSEVDLSKEEVVHFARNVIQTIQCEWEGCTITLNSWDTLAKLLAPDFSFLKRHHLPQVQPRILQLFPALDEVAGFVCRITWLLLEEHLLRHCSRVNQRDGMYQCSYSRCSGRLHNSLRTLKVHVELSHLSRVALRCPAYSCNEVFVRVQQLQIHFEHVHRELLEKPVSVDALAPLAKLARRRLLQPPPLPHHTARADSLLASVSMPPVRLGNSQASASGISRKWSRLNVQDVESDVNLIAFDDLPSLQTRDILTPRVVDVEVRRKLPLAKQPLLSGPQPAIYPPIRSNESKQSILYPAFVRMVDSLAAAGTLAGHKEGGM